MKVSYSVLCTGLLAACTLAACGGGGGGSTASSGGVTPPVSNKNVPRITMAFTGTSTLAHPRHAMALAGIAVSVTYNGKTVGSGQLDANGAATIELESDVPEGATVSVTAGSVTATFVLAHTTEDTAVLVQVNTNGTITVSVASGTQPEPSPSPGDPNGESETENDNGAVESVNENDGNSTLPANLPFTVSATCTTVTLTPALAAIANLRFEENVEDSDGGSKFKYEGPFTAAMSFPLVSQTARLRIELFDAQNAQLLDVRAPLTAFGVSSCATPSPGASATPEPSASPSP